MAGIFPTEALSEQHLIGFSSKYPRGAVDGNGTGRYPDLRGHKYFVSIRVEPRKLTLALVPCVFAQGAGAFYIVNERRH